MTQFEFTARTQVEVSAKEFDAINTVYMASDLDKDEFCKVWMKMNVKRVRAAKSAAAARERILNLKDKCFDIIEKYKGANILSYAAEALEYKDARFLKSLGFDLYNTKFGGVPLIGDATWFAREWVAAH